MLSPLFLEPNAVFFPSLTPSLSLLSRSSGDGARAAERSGGLDGDGAGRSSDEQRRRLGGQAERWWIWGRRRRRSRRSTEAAAWRSTAANFLASPPLACPRCLVRVFLARRGSLGSGVAARQIQWRWFVRRGARMAVAVASSPPRCPPPQTSDTDLAVQDDRGAADELRAALRRHALPVPHDRWRPLTPTPLAPQCCF
uniref:Uncharacterized protein n=1 Tax=Oryza barthii TaxID=65489 RepID=A0A0D3GKG4_9ORYZ